MVHSLGGCPHDWTNSRWTEPNLTHPSLTVIKKGGHQGHEIAKDIKNTKC